jgi:hypothetical protein
VLGQRLSPGGLGARVRWDLRRIRLRLGCGRLAALEHAEQREPQLRAVIGHSLTLLANEPLLELAI